MPMVTIQVTREGVTKEHKKALIAGVSNLLLEVLGKPVDSTFVIIEEVDTDNWGWCGIPVTEIRANAKA